MGVRKSPSVNVTDFFQLGFSLLDFFLKQHYSLNLMVVWQTEIRLNQITT